MKTVLWVKDHTLKEDKQSSQEKDKDKFRYVRQMAKYSMWVMKWKFNKKSSQTASLQGIIPIWNKCNLRFLVTVTAERDVIFFTNLFYIVFLKNIKTKECKYSVHQSLIDALKKLTIDKSRFHLLYRLQSRNLLTHLWFSFIIEVKTHV